MKGGPDLQNGFTLIETLIYLSIVATILVIVGSSAVRILGIKTESRAKADIGYNIKFFLHTTQLNVNKSLGPKNFSVGDSGNSIELNMENSNIDPTVIELNNGQIFKKEGSNPSKAITGKEVNVERLNFTYLGTSSKPGSLRTSLRITATSSNDRILIENSTSTFNFYQKK